MAGVGIGPARTDNFTNQSGWRNEIKASES